MDVWAEVASARRELADYLETLDESAWNEQSLCAKWKVRDVVGHLNMPLTTPVPKIALAVATNGFNFDKANDKLSRKISASSSPADMVAVLRAKADKRIKPPGAGPEAPLTDITVHTSDIRRPLGAPPLVPGNRAEAILDFLTKTKAQGFVGKGWREGLRFEATDVEWSYGEGAVVRGPAEALILALSGRRVALDDLEGDGVEVLRSRLPQ